LATSSIPSLTKTCRRALILPSDILR